MLKNAVFFPWVVKWKVIFLNTWFISLCKTHRRSLFNLNEWLELCFHYLNYVHFLWFHGARARKKVLVAEIYLCYYLEWVYFFKLHWRFFFTAFQCLSDYDSSRDSSGHRMIELFDCIVKNSQHSNSNLTKQHKLFKLKERQFRPKKVGIFVKDYIAVHLSRFTCYSFYLPIHSFF